MDTKDLRALAISLPVQTYNHMISFIAKAELMSDSELNAVMEAITLTAVEEREDANVLALLTALHSFIETVKEES